MKAQRRLVLRREALTQLDPNELHGVAGATHVFTDCGCVTHGYSCDQCPVPSLPVNTCVCNTIGKLQCIFGSLTC